MDTVNIERSKKTNRWVKGRSTSGCCFTISPDRLQEILRTGKLPQAFPNWKLKPTEYVDRLVMNEQGITVYVEDNRI